MQSMHIICTICTDVITQDDLQYMYVTSCGHVFHYHCLTQWTERSPSCPQCRTKISNNSIFRVYPTLSEETKHDTIIDSFVKCQAQLEDKMKEKEHELAMVNAKLADRERMLNEYENVFEKNVRVIARLKKQLAASKKQTDETARLTIENTKLRERLVDLSMKKCNKKINSALNEYKQSRKNEERKPAKKRQHKHYRKSVAGNRKRRSKDNNGNLQESSSDSMLESSNTSSESESETEAMNSDSASN